MTPKLCEGLCYNFTYFGVEDSSQCFCGSTLTPGYAKAPNSDCNSPCAGNASEFCGNVWRLDVYSLTPANPPVKSYTAQGCYVDDSSRALRGAEYVNNEMTPQLCAGLCTGSEYFGVEYGSQCFCGSELAAGYIQAPGTDCNYTCTGDASQLCGGFWRLNLYSFQ